MDEHIEKGPLTGRAFHLVGVGGAGMSVVAQLLQDQGAKVTGSDRNDSQVLQDLLPQGIGAYFPHDAGRVPQDATLVLSSAIRQNNPELVIARERGQEIIHRSEALAIAASGHDFVAVAGAHGKTSTSAMIAIALLNCGYDPSYAIGGPVLGEGSGARMGRCVFVAEADESDGSFLHYSPAVEVITNVEPDHLDHFGSEEGFFGIFEQFVDRLIPSGTLICCAQDKGASRIAQYGRDAANVGRVWTYGFQGEGEGEGGVGRASEPTVSISEVSLGPTGAQAKITMDGASYLLDLQVTGAHNVLNATAAWAACVAVGADPDAAASALSHFRGAGRRFELRADIGGRRVFNDYAHHPTEIEAALRQARIVAGDGRLIAVFQPHLYSRTANFAERFAKGLSLADEVVLTDIYAAREDPMEGVTMATVSDTGAIEVPYHLVGDARDAALFAGSLTQPGDVLLLIGAGDIFMQAPAVAQQWSRWTSTDK